MRASKTLCLGSLLFLIGILQCKAWPQYTFVVEETPYKRLCSTKNILTVNGQFPGPTLYVHKGDTIIVDVYNKAKYNITIHWHGVKQPRYPWSDGPEFITQCPIQPGAKFSQKVIFSTEEGTLWWHAHSDWSRVTVHGAIVIYPKKDSSYPFPKPDAEVPIILGEWWKKPIMEVYHEMLRTGGDPNVSDAYTINGQPGDLYPCSMQDTFKLRVEQGMTYLLRIINVAMQDLLFFSIANHSLTVVATDASYTKPLTRDIITISPGQTIDVLLKANQNPDRYHHQSTSTCKSASSAILPLFLSLIPTALVRITFSVSLPRRRRRRHRPEMGSSGAGSPCGACKFLRRKCAADCVFAPYFRTEQGPARFAAIHKVFGASNVAKLLLHVPVAERCEAVFTIAYEAQARLRDPVYGCVSHIFALQQQVVYLQAQLMQVKAQLAQNLMTNSINNSVAMPNPHQQLGGDGSNNNMSGVQAFAANHMMMMSNNSASPTSSLESIDHSNNSNNSNSAMMMVHREMESNRDDCYNYQELSFMLPPSSCTTKKRPPNCDLSELQALAHTMMRNGS